MPHLFGWVRLNKRVLIPALAPILVGVTLSSAAAVPAAAAPNNSAAVGHVYVNDNTAGTNTIAAFDRFADGSLSPVPGSPFAAGGAGTGKGLASQGAARLPGVRYSPAATPGSPGLGGFRACLSDA